MDLYDITIRASKPQAYRDIIGLWVAGEKPNGQFITSKLILEEGSEGCYYPPIMQLDFQQAQLLMDDLWACGIRPVEGAGTAGSMAAVEKHLQDMRMIAFNKLKIEIKKKP